MPWTVADVDRHKRGLTDREKAQWVAIANSALAACMKKPGAKEEQCAGNAIRQANGVVGNDAAQFSSYHVQENSYTIRTEVHQGRKHIVVPVVMMVEGVHNGSHGPLLHLAEDLGRFPAAWDGIPIIVHHPEDGMSANRPAIVDQQVVGRVYNTAMDGPRLRAEAWLDEVKLQQVSALALAYIRQGRQLDVSAGVFTEEDGNAGVWNGEHYIARSQNHRPDHLALLPGGMGACSWADGCGVRLNRSFEEGGDGMTVNSELVINALRYSGTESTPWHAPVLGDFGVDGQWGDLSPADRSKVATHFLIGSASVETFGDMKLPVVNPKTGKLNEGALRAVISGRGAQVGGVSAEARSAARRRAYRLLNSEFDAGLTVPENLELIKQLAAEGFTVTANDQGYREVMQAIQTKLDNMDDDMKMHFLQEVFDDSFVYEVKGRNGGAASSLFKRGYQANQDGSVEFTGEPTPVRRKVEYVAYTENFERKIKTNKKKEVEDMKEKIDKLIANCRTGCFTEASREKLQGLDEQMVDQLLIMQEATNKKLDDVEKDKGRPVTQEQALQVLREQFKDTEKALALFPPEIASQLRYGMKVHQEQRTRLIDGIKNATQVYTDDELTAMSTEQLDKVAQIAKVPVDYSGAVTLVDNSAVEVAPLMDLDGLAAIDRAAKQQQAQK